MVNKITCVEFGFLFRWYLCIDMKMYKSVSKNLVVEQSYQNIYEAIILTCGNMHTEFFIDTVKSSGTNLHTYGQHKVVDLNWKFYWHKQISKAAASKGSRG